MKYLFRGVSLKNMRQTNMDSLLLKSRRIIKSNAMIAVVCDGVGSLTDGGFASAMAVRLLIEWFSSVNSTNHIGLRMRDAVYLINARIISESKQKNLETASTLSALLLIEHNYYITHLGDSRIYCYEDKTDALSILTNDDVSESGKLSAYIGKTEDIFLQYSEGTAIGKTFLVCSDGLYKRMDAEFMTNNLKTWNAKAKDKSLNALSQYVIERGERDNISLALIKTEGPL